MLIEAIGWLGTACILGTFFWITTHPANRVYWVINLLGCLFLLINVWHHHAIPSVFINVAWAMIALRGMWVTRVKRNPVPGADVGLLALAQDPGMHSMLRRAYPFHDDV